MELFTRDQTRGFEVTRGPEARGLRRIRGFGRGLIIPHTHPKILNNPYTLNFVNIPKKCLYIHFLGEIHTFATKI